MLSITVIIFIVIIILIEYGNKILKILIPRVDEKIADDNINIDTIDKEKLPEFIQTNIDQSMKITTKEYLELIFFEDYDIFINNNLKLDKNVMYRLNEGTIIDIIHYEHVITLYSNNFLIND